MRLGRGHPWPRTPREGDAPHKPGIDVVVVQEESG